MENIHNSQFEDFQYFESLSSGDYNPVTRTLAYGIEYYNENKSAKVQEIRILDTETGMTSVISANGFGEGNPKWSPEGERLLFLSALPGFGRQIFLYHRADGSVRKLTTMGIGILDPVWSMDGSRILFASPCDSLREDSYYTQGIDQAPDHSKDPVVITDFGYKFDGAGFVQPENLHLWVVEVSTGRTRRITDGPYDYLHHRWSPDGNQVLCVSSRFRSKKDSIAADLVVIDLNQNCEIRQLTEKNWAVSYPNPVRPTYTPDGSHIIMGFLDASIQEDANQSKGYPPAFLHRISLDGAEDVCLMKETKDCFDGVEFPYNPGCGRGMDKICVSEDGQYAYFLSGYMGQSKLFKVGLKGENPVVESVLGGKRVIGGIAPAGAGRLLLSMSWPDVPEGYYLYHETTGSLELLVQSNEEYLNAKALASPEDFMTETLDGESILHGFALPPQGMEKGNQYPCILYIHGGPHPFYTYGFTLEHQAFSGNGFGVLYCNPRGSSGYGSVHRNLERAMDGSAYMDILQFVEEACRRYEWIDKDRIGVTGGSYGGYMTNYIAIHTQRFKAFVTQRCVANDLIGYASSDMQGDSSAYPNFEEFMVDQLKSSTVTYVERINRPFLILHGMDDYRTPVEGAHQLFVALKDLHPDLPVKMVLYPHTGHEQPREPRQQLHYYNQMKTWFEKYL